MFYSSHVSNDREPRSLEVIHVKPKFPDQAIQIIERGLGLSPAENVESAAFASYDLNFRLEWDGGAEEN